MPAARSCRSWRLDPLILTMHLFILLTWFHLSLASTLQQNLKPRGSVVQLGCVSHLTTFTRLTQHRRCTELEPSLIDRFERQFVHDITMRGINLNHKRSSYPLEAHLNVNLNHVHPPSQVHGKHALAEHKPLDLHESIASTLYPESSHVAELEESKPQPELPVHASLRSGSKARKHSGIAVSAAIHRRQTLQNPINVYFHVISADGTVAGGNITYVPRLQVPTHPPILKTPLIALFSSDTQVMQQMTMLNTSFRQAGVQFVLAGLDRTINADWFNNGGPETFVLHLIPNSTHTADLVPHRLAHSKQQ